MSRNWEDVRKSINEFFATAAEKTDEFIKVGKRKISITEIKRNITSHYAELGGRVYHLIRRGDVEGVASDGEVESLVSRIQKLEDELKAKEIEIEEIRMATEKATKAPVSPVGSAEEREAEVRSEPEGEPEKQAAESPEPEGEPKREGAEGPEAERQDSEEAKPQEPKRD
jgi:gas vesicle protein